MLLSDCLLQISGPIVPLRPHLLLTLLCLGQESFVNVLLKRRVNIKVSISIHMHQDSRTIHTPPKPKREIIKKKLTGRTPPPAMVARISESSSSSPRIASCKWRGVMRFTLRSLVALPANSSTSAVRYSRIAAEYTAALAPTRTWFWVRSFK